MIATVDIPPGAHNEQIVAFEQVEVVPEPGSLLLISFGFVVAVITLSKRFVTLQTCQGT